LALIKSISGIRGTIGGNYGTNLTPQDIVECTAAFGTWILKNRKDPKRRAQVVIGRDARMSGAMVSSLVTNTLLSLGIDVLDLGLSTTPTVEVAVATEGADGGIILTASHNPKEWNALKLLNGKGEFISAADGKAVLDLIESGTLNYADVDELGTLRTDDSYIQKHIDQIFALELVDVELVKSKAFRVVVDPVNSTGAISIVPLLEQMGCKVTVINGEMTGNFAHNPEPLPEHLNELAVAVTYNKAHLGIAVDPDVDRLAFVRDDGEMFGEEYTLVAIADYILQNKPGNTVSNLSSTKALRDITEKRGGIYEAAAVGEVNVVTKMKEIGAVIGGEGNGGVIYPELHYGRDALVGVALMLTSLAQFGKPLSFLRKRFPEYVIAKRKLDLPNGVDVDVILNKLDNKYATFKTCTRNRVDGLKIEFSDGNWIHMRKSNTEPIIRVYAESTSEVIASNLIAKINRDIYEILNEEKD
jgi:phosphomannomutase